MPNDHVHPMFQSILRDLARPPPPSRTQQAIGAVTNPKPAPLKCTDCDGTGVVELKLGGIFRKLGCPWCEGEGIKACAICGEHATAEVGIFPVCGKPACVAEVA